MTVTLPCSSHSEFRIRRAFLWTACFLGLMLPGTVRAWQNPPALPPDPPEKIANDPARLAHFELAQLRLGLANQWEQNEHLLSAAHLRLQAATAFERAGLSQEANREMSLGLSQSSVLKFGIPPLKHVWSNGQLMPFLPRRGPKPLYWSRISQDGRWLCRAEQTGWIDVWDLESGTQKQRFLANDPVRTDLFKMRLVEFTPDARLAICLAHNSTEFWNLETGELAYRLEPQPRTLFTRIAISPNGKNVVLGRHDGRLVFTTVDHPERHETVSFDDYSDHEVIAFSPNGERVLVSRISHNRSQTETIILDVNEREEVFRRVDPWQFVNPLKPMVHVVPEMTSWGPTDDEILLVKGIEGQDADVLVQNILTQEVTTKIPIRLTRFFETQILWDAVRSRIILHGGEQPVRMFDYPSGKLALELPDSKYTPAVFILRRPFMGYVYVTSKAGLRSSLWKPDGQPYPYMKVPTVLGVAELPERQLTAFFSETQIQVFAGDRPFEIQRLEMPDIGEVKFLADGSRLLAVATHRRSPSLLGAMLWDFQQSRAATPTQEWQHPEMLAGLSWCSDQRLLTWGGTAVRLWSRDQSKPVLQAESQHPIRWGTVSGEFLWTLDARGELSQWRIKNLELQNRKPVGPWKQFLPTKDGTHLLSWDQDFQVSWRTWPESQTVSQFAHPRDLAGGFLSEDGQLAVTWSIDKTVIVRNLQTGETLLERKHPVAVDQALLFGDNWSQLAIFGADLSLMLGDVTRPETIKMVDVLSPLATPASEALHRERLSGDQAVRQALLRRQPTEKQGPQLVEVNTGNVIPMQALAMDVYGNASRAGQFHLLHDRNRLLSWGASPRVVMSSVSGVVLQAFDHRPPAAEAASVANNKFYSIVIGEPEEQLLTADETGLIRLWKLPPPMPRTPQEALLNLELKSKQHINRFGQMMWLKPEQLEACEARRQAE